MPHLAKWLIPIGVIALVLLLMQRFPYAMQDDLNTPHLFYLILLGGMIAAGMRIVTWQDLGEKAKHLLVWGLIFVVLILGYAQKDVLQRALLPQMAMTGEGASVVIQRADDGQFYVEAEVNGQPVLFMIDTGASDISLSPDDATRVGLHPETLSYDKIYQTANGIGHGASVTLRRLTIGTIILDDVPASVNKTPMDTSLLGMGYLERFDRVEIVGDQLIIWPPSNSSY